jgi:hypothetical protein
VKRKRGISPSGKIEKQSISPEEGVSLDAFYCNLVDFTCPDQYPTPAAVGRYPGL